MSTSIKNSLILLKPEVTPGVDAGPTASANAVGMQVEDFACKIEQRVASNETVGGGFGTADAIPYTRRGKVTFKTPLAAPANVVSPAWAALLKTCAVAEATGATVVYTPASTALKTATLWGYVNGQVEKFAFGAGNVKFLFAVGQVPTMAFEYTSLVSSVASATAPGGNLAGWKRPMAFGPASCGGVVLGGTLAGGNINGGSTYALKNLELDAGNEVVDLEMAGAESVGVYDWEPKVTFVADVTPAGLAALYAAMNAGALTTVGLKHGPASGMQITVFAPNCQITDIEDQREGKLFLAKVTLTCLPTAAGDDAWKVVLSDSGTPPVNQPPVVAIATPADGVSVTVNQPVSLTVNASDSDGAVVSVRYFRGATQIGQSTAGPTFPVTWTPTNTGNVTLTAKATDDAGAETTSAAVNVTVTSVAVPVAPTLADLEPFRTAGTAGQFKSSTFVVPYTVDGGVTRSWTEAALGGAASTRITIRTPAFDPPAGGYAMLIGAHPTTNTGYEDWIAPTRPAATLFDGWLAQDGVTVNVDFAHPQASLGSLPAGTAAPFWDVAYATQAARSFHAALNLNLTEVYGIGRSRGSQIMIQVLSPDRADANATTYAGRMSSKLKAVVIMQGQAFYVAKDDPVTGAPGFVTQAIVSADRAAAIAASPADDSRVFAMPSIYTLARTTQTDALVLYEADEAWLGRQVTWAEYNNAGLVPDKVHYQETPLWMRSAFTEAGKASQIAINTQTGSGSAANYAKYLAWLRSIKNKPAAITRTVTAAEHLAMAQAALDGCNLYYIPSDATGCVANSDGTGTVAPGTTVGGIVDWGLGLANAVNVPLASQVQPAAMNAAQYLPSAVAVNGSQMALVCATGKYLQVGRGNTSVVAMGYTAAGEVSVLRARASGNYKFCGDNQTAGVVVATVNVAAVPATTLRAARQLAAEIMGVAYSLTA